MEGGDQDPGYLLESDAATDLREDVFKLATQKRWTILGLQQKKLSLEEVFRALTKGNHESH
jgi:hypothetical protein